MKVAHTRTITNKNYLSKKLNFVVKEGELLDIAKLFLRASNIGAFEDRKTLYYFLVHIAKNLVSVKKNNSKENAKCYHPTDLVIFDYMKFWQI